MKSLLCIVAMMGCAACATPSRPAPSAATSSEAAPLFRFHVDFWPNLNQVMLHEALVPRPGFAGPKSLRNRHVVTAETLAPAEAEQWHKALGYYDSHFDSDNLFDHFTEAMPALHGLGPTQVPPTTTDIDQGWQSHLVLAAPIYKARFWPDHERKDRAYVERMRPLIAAHGAWFAKRLVAVYGTPLPTGPIDVDVTPAVPLFGGFTRGEPPYTGEHEALITLSSEDPAYAGDTGVEMLFHEVSHLLVGRVQEGLEASAKRQGRKVGGRLWHDVIFYTAGHLTQERFGPTYVPYAERPTSQLFDGAAHPTVVLLKRCWQPYLDGRTTLDAAIDAIVASLPAD